MIMQLDAGCFFEIADADERAESTLIYVKGFAVVICKTDSGVLVDVYAKGREFCETLGRCQVSDVLAQKERDEGL